MESCDRHAGIIIEPNDNARALRVETSVIRAGNRISPPTAGNDCERFKWSCFQMSPDIANHDDQYNSRWLVEANRDAIFPRLCLDRSLRPAQPFHRTAERGAVIAAR